MAPQVVATVNHARNEGRLQLLAGRVIAAQPSPGADGIDVAIRLHPRLGAQVVVEHFDLVVSCIGPTHNVTVIDNPFIQALLRRRLAQSHATGLGFVVGHNNALVHAGCETAGVHVIGPLSRGACGDIVGVPEISRQAREVIENLIFSRSALSQTGAGHNIRPPAAA